MNKNSGGVVTVGPTGVGIAQRAQTLTRLFHEHRRLWLLVAASFLIRLLVLFVVTRFFGHLVATKLNDIGYYNQRSWWLASRWRQGDLVSPFAMPGAVTEVGYYCLVALEMTVFGHLPIVASLANIMLGCINGVLAYAIAKSLFTRSVPALIAAALVLFWPSLILWSVLNLKDTLALTLMAVILLQILRTTTGKSSVASTWASFGALVLLEQVRWYAFVLCGLSYLFAVLYADSKVASKVTIATALVAIMAASLTFGVGAQTASIALSGHVSHVISNFSGGASGTNPGTVSGSSPSNTSGMSHVGSGAGSSPSNTSGMSHVGSGAGSSPSNTSGMSPVSSGAGSSPSNTSGVSHVGSGAGLSPGSLVGGVARILLEPLPWQHGDILLKLGAVEDLLYYAVLVLGVTELVRRVRSGDLWSRSLLITLLGLVTIYALIVGNIGSDFRYRAQLLFWLLILSAGPLDVLLRRYIPERWRKGILRSLMLSP